MQLELRHFWRMTCKNLGLTVMVVLVLAIGIAGTTAIFAIINTVLLKPLPYSDSNSLVRISLDNPKRNQRDSEFSLTRYEQIRDNAQSFADFGAFFHEDVTFSVHDDPEQLLGFRVSANFLKILGATPELGRGFLAAEDTPGASSVAILSDQLWRRRFAARQDVIGTNVKINSALYTVIGVMPAGFQFPSPGTDIWTTRISQPPGIQYGTPATTPYLTGVARLKSNVTFAQTRAEMNALSMRYAMEHAGFLDADPAASVRIVSLQEHMVENVRPALWVLFGAVGFVLLIACANVASLLLTRAISRTQEFALRTALGAARGTLLRQLSMESVFLALIGGLLGVLLAYWGLQLILTTSSGRLPRAVEIHIDIRVLLFTLTVCLGTAVLFGLLPWFHAARTNLANALRDQRIASSVSRHRILGVNARSLLVVVQVAMAIVLLIGASLMIESFKHLRQVELGFEPSNLLTMQIALPPSRYDSDRKKAAFYQELVQRVATVPGVRGVAVAASLPTASSIQFPIQIAGHPLMNTGLRPLGQWQAISNNYFRSLGTALQRGREFTEHDNADSSWVVIINESLARRFWPDYPRGQDPIGQHMLFGPGNSISPEIVGVVADVHEVSLDADNGPEAYMPLAQRCPQTMHLLVRTEGEPRRMENAIRAQVVGVDPDQPVSKVRTMEEVLETSVASQRLTILVLVFFAGVALVLSTVGIYGVISYSVAQRTKELGIRMALGAQARDVLGLVLQQALTLTLSGIGIGIAGAFLLTRLLGRLLFHVSPTDPLTFGLIAIAFSLVAMIASYLPARRAMRVNVVVALQ